MTTKEEQDQRPLWRRARHIEAVLKQQTWFPDTLHHHLSLQPLCHVSDTHKSHEHVLPQLMPALCAALKVSVWLSG